jgi:hypothetical protein
MVRCRFEESQPVAHRRSIRRVIVVGAAALAAMTADADRGRILAQSKLDAQYTVTLGGLQVGRGAWTIDISDDRFSATASGATAGLMSIIASGHGQTVVRGNMSGGQMASVTYASSIVTDQKYDEVRMVLSGGSVKEFVADPANVPSPDRVPLTEAHRHGVSDPMTASLLRVPGTGDTLIPQACQRRVSVFDGRMRYDLLLAFKRFERVRTEKGYQGTVVVCTVRFLPIAGYVPDRAAIKYIAELRDIEVWAAPLAGTRLMVPYRVSVPTPIGVGVMQATQFISVAQPSKASVKAQ